MVVIHEIPDGVEVVFRRRIEIADAAIRGSKQPFHAAEPLPFAEAEQFLERCKASTEGLAREAMQGLLKELREKGYEATRCSVLLAAGRPLPALEAILASHALIHTAEGEFYRNAMIEASEHCGLPVAGVKERELVERCEEQLGRIADLGRTIGPPWTQDQKYAALAAWQGVPQGRPAG